MQLCEYLSPVRPAHRFTSERRFSLAVAMRSLWPITSRGQAGRLDPRVTLHKLSVEDPHSLTALVQETRPALICHLAAQIDVRVSVADPAADAQVNVISMINVLEAARTVGARVVFASSGGALYGRDAAIPSPEDALTLPESPYGVAKLCAEHYIGLYNRLHGTKHSVLRLANVYGPRQDPAGEAGVIAVFCASVVAGRAPTIYGDGTQTRDYVYVGDVVRAFIAAADAGSAGDVEYRNRHRDECPAANRHHWRGRRTGDTAGVLRSPAGEVAAQCGGCGPCRAGPRLQPLTLLPVGMLNVYRWIEAGAPVRAAS